MTTLYGYQRIKMKIFFIDSIIFYEQNLIGRTKKSKTDKKNKFKIFSKHKKKKFKTLAIKGKEAKRFII